ncbi:MAG: hypothetical protein ACYTEO_14645, partial [Planctomycetota bacterium]
MNARNPQDVFVFFDDFMGPSASIEPDSDMLTDGTSPCGPWTLTAVTANSAIGIVDATYTALSTLGGVLRITTVASPDDGTNLQVAGQAFVIDADCGLPLYFEARFRTADVSNTYFFVGLSKVDVEIVTTGMDDAIGFLMESGTLYCSSAESSAEKNVDSAITEADGAATTDAGWVRGKFTFDGNDKVSFFIDDDDDGEFDFITSLTVSTTLDYLPDDQTLTPTIEVITGTTYS